MPEIEIPVPIPGEDEMAADISNDAAELLFEQTARNHQALQHDTRANEQSAHNVLNHSTVKKYNEVDPIQSAAVEMVLGKAQKVANG